MRSLIPTRRQWQTWSLPSKLTAIGTGLGLLGIALSLLLAASPSSSDQQPPTGIQNITVSPGSTARIVQNNTTYYVLDCTPKGFMATATNEMVSIDVIREALQIAGITNIQAGQERSQLVQFANEYAILKKRIQDSPAITDEERHYQRLAMNAIDECDPPRAAQYASIIPMAPSNFRIVPN